MSEIMVEVTQAVIIICLVLLMKYLVPWIKAKIEESQYDWVAGVVEDAVLYAEQTIIGEHMGPRKIEVVTRYVKECLALKNISISDEQLRTIIESTVYTMKEVSNGN